MKRTYIRILALALAPSLALAERLYPGDVYLRQLHQELTLFMAPSLFYWPVLVASFIAALAVVGRIAERKHIRIASPSIIIPAGCFLLFLFLFVSLRTSLAEIVIDLAGLTGDFLPWAKPPFLLGSEWYAGALLSLAWFVTHPLVLGRNASKTNGKALLKYVPSLVLGAVALLWLFTGFFVGFMMYI